MKFEGFGIIQSMEKFGVLNGKSLVWIEMEWKVLKNMEYGKFLFHSIP